MQSIIQLPFQARRGGRLVVRAKRLQLILKAFDLLIAGFDVQTDLFGLLFREAPLHLLKRLEQGRKFGAMDQSFVQLPFQGRRAGVRGLPDGRRSRRAVRVEDLGGYLFGTVQI